MEPINFLKDNWDLIIQNPKIAALCFVAGCAAGFSATYFIVSERIKSRDETIAKLQDSVNQYRVSLGIDAQKPTKYQLLSNKELKSVAMTTADRVNDLGKEFLRTTGPGKMAERLASENPSQSSQMETIKTIERAQDVLDKYKRNYAANVVLLYVEMKARGATSNANEKYLGFTLEHPNNAFSLNEIATMLRTMAETLPG